jgi:hypothetical protein
MLKITVILTKNWRLINVFVVVMENCQSQKLWSSFITSFLTHHLTVKLPGWCHLGGEERLSVREGMCLEALSKSPMS